MPIFWQTSKCGERHDPFRFSERQYREQLQEEQELGIRRQMRNWGQRHEEKHYRPGTPPPRSYWGYMPNLIDRFDHYQRHGEHNQDGLTYSLTRLLPPTYLVSPTMMPQKARYSPPPITEVQIGPQSPGAGPGSATASENEGKPESDGLGSIGRVRPGTKAAHMACPPLKPLPELESAFQLQEYLKSLFYNHTRALDSEYATRQLTRETAMEIANPPTGTDRSLWLYELCRLLVIKADQLIVNFFTDDPPCSAQTCPEMRASEWQYLCAVHDPPKACCAIDYCCHTLDWAALTLASQKHFPSRLTLGNDANGGSQAGVRQLTNIMRRVYRIFAHAWFQHRQVFWQVESSEGLYMLFKTVCDVYNLIPEENYTIPAEAEGLAAKDEEKREGKAILNEQGNEENVKANDANTTATTPAGATTRRHKATASFSSSVAAIAEGDEEDNKAESPTKDQTSVPAEVLPSPKKEAPLAQISKTAEKNEEEPAAVEEKLDEQPGFVSSIEKEGTARHDTEDTKASKPRKETATLVVDRVEVGDGQDSGEVET